MGDNGNHEREDEQRSGRDRGLGRIYQPTYKDKRTGEKKHAATWWVQYNVRGVTHRESSGSMRRSAAVKLLRHRVAQAASGKWVAPKVERTTFDELAELLMTDYTINKKRSAARMGRAVKHLTDAFGGVCGANITPDRIQRYIRDRQTAGAANATINRELAALKRMFRLGDRMGKVVRVPPITLLREDNARKGFFEPEQFNAVLNHVSDDLRAVFEVAYITGWRMKSEVLTRQWSHVDFNAGWLRLEPGETKNREGRMFPMTTRLREVLLRQRTRTTAVERDESRIVPHVFHRAGKPIRDFSVAWRNACKAAGCPGRIPHDFRRTAVRNLERAGVPRSSAMKMVGHKTEAIYRRYAITDEAMLKEGAALLSVLHDAEAGKKPAASGEVGK